MRVVSFSLIFLLCVSCASVTKVDCAKETFEPVAIPFTSKVAFEQLVITPPKQYWLVWSNSNPSIVKYQIDSKITTDGNWKFYTGGYHWQFSETNVPIYMTNTQQYFRVGFTWP